MTLLISTSSLFSPNFIGVERREELTLMIKKVSFRNSLPSYNPALERPPRKYEHLQPDATGYMPSTEIDVISDKLNLRFPTLSSLKEAHAEAYKSALELQAAKNPKEQREEIFKSFLEIQKMAYILVERMKSHQKELANPKYEKAIWLIAINLLTKFHIDVFNLWNSDIVNSPSFKGSNITVEEMNKLEIKGIQWSKLNFSLKQPSYLSFAVKTGLLTGFITLGLLCMLY